MDRLANLALGLKITNFQSNYRAFMTSIKDIHCFNTRSTIIKNEIPSNIGKVGLCMKVSFLQTFPMGRSLHFGPTMFMVVLFTVGSFMSLTGILLHSLTSILSDKRSIRSNVAEDLS